MITNALEHHTFAGSGSSPAGIAAKNLPTFAAKNLSTYGPHLKIARVPSQPEHNTVSMSNFIYHRDRAQQEMACCNWD